MSAGAVYSFATAQFGAGGPGLAAYYRFQSGWIDEARVVTYPLDETAAQTFSIAPLGATGALPVMLAVPFDANDANRFFTVEYREATGWDAGFPSNVVLIHEIRHQPDLGYVPYVLREQMGFEEGVIHLVDGRATTYHGKDNTPFTGDFNGDGFDDIGVKWISGPHEGKWTISLNDTTGGFAVGATRTIGGADTAFKGANVPIIGDFNGDNFDDIGVKWTSGDHEGEWTISLNDKSGGFDAGQTLTVGGSTTSYIGDNVPIVGDFNGDGFDDIGVKWLSGSHMGKWTISTNDRAGAFNTGTTWLVAGDDRTYEGPNVPIVGDFNGDGFDDIGVRWVSGDHAGLWTISLNDTNTAFRSGQIILIAGRERTYEGDNTPLVGDIDNDGYDDVGVKWQGGDHDGTWTFSSNNKDQGQQLPVQSVDYNGVRIVVQSIGPATAEVMVSR